MKHVDPSAVGPLRFSIGTVLAVAWPSFLRHYLALVSLCITAGFAGFMLPAVFSEWVPALSLREHPMARELAKISLAIPVVTPALILLSQSYKGQPLDFLHIAAKSAQRVITVVVSEVVLDAVLLTPVYFILPRPELWTDAHYLIYLVYEISLHAFNFVFLATLATESTNPLVALGRTVRLLRGHWWRMYVLASLLWLASAAMAVAARYGAQYAIVTLNWPWRWQKLIFGPMPFCVRLLIVIPVAVAAYHLLRYEKDGPPAPDTARIFD